MKNNLERLSLIKEVQEEFNHAYPFLKIEFFKKRDGNQGAIRADGAADASEVSEAARQLLWTSFGLGDGMKVEELEVLLQYHFGLPAQVLRKSGNMWIETRMTRHWTLRQQNDHGQDITGFA